MRWSVFSFAFLMFFSLTGCNNDDKIVGNYICNTGDSIDRDEIEISISKNSKATFKHRNEIIKGRWDGDSNKINTYFTIHGHSGVISLIKTGKFNLDFEIYTLTSEGKSVEDACLKLKQGSFDDIQKYEYIAKKSYLNALQENAENLSTLKTTLFLIKSSLDMALLDGKYIKRLSTNNTKLFDVIFQNPLQAGTSKGKWSKKDSIYYFHLTKNKVISFMYDSKNSKFECIYNCQYLK